jgi:hypothetical protein
MKARLLPALLLAAAFSIPHLLLPAPAEAQGTYSVAGYSMAGARGTALRDIDAALVNPALLGLPGARSFSMRLFSFNSHLDQNFMSIGRWNRWQGSFIDQAEKDKYLNTLGKAANVRMQAELGTFGVQVGRLSFGAYHTVNAEARVPTDLFDLLLNGNQLNRTYHFGEFGLSTEAVSVIHASYAFPMPAAIDSFIKLMILPVKEIWAGVGLKYYMGHLYAGVDEGTIDFTFGEDGVWGNADYRYHSAGMPGSNIDEESDDPLILADDSYSPSAGSGIGLDLGIAAVVDDALTVHAALLNLSTGIKWKSSTYDVRLTASADTIGLGTFMEFDEDAEETDIDSLTSYDVELERIDAFRTPVPVIFRVGSTYRVGKNLALNAEFEHAISRGLGYRPVPRLALGFEYRLLNVMPIRAGMSIGGRHGMVGAFGLGLDLRALVFEIAVANTGLTPGGVRGMGAAAGLKVSF